MRSYLTELGAIVELFLRAAGLEVLFVAYSL